MTALHDLSVNQHLPHLLDDIRAIVDSQSQTDPTFRTTRLYTRLSAAEVRRQLIAQKDYTDEALPCEATILAAQCPFDPSHVLRAQISRWQHAVLRWTLADRR